MVAPVAGKSRGDVENDVVGGGAVGTQRVDLVEVVCGGGGGADEDGGGGDHQVGFFDDQRRQDVVERRQAPHFGVIVRADFVSVNVIVDGVVVIVMVGGGADGRGRRQQRRRQRLRSAEVVDDLRVVLDASY